MGLRRIFKFDNKWIVILKIALACGLLFISGLFFFQNLNVFIDDFSALYGAPVIFFLAIAFCCFYIGYLVNRIEARDLQRAEKLDILYKVIFSVVLVYIGLRDFFVAPFLQVTVPLLIALICIGVLNWLVPPIKLHEDEDF